MKQIDVLKLGDAVWVHKRKGYRIRCQEYGENQRVELLMPFESELPMDSDLAAWRIAFKLSQTGVMAEDGKPQYTDITVVDDQGNPIEYYVTGQQQTLNPVE